ncbi:MAG: SsrA-binding protein SmpB [Candidatus Gracilibacteria bacterium]|nr:SsrA-binding protein SmpB [Candidatus Gracilibacteria bacterium]
MENSFAKNRKALHDFFVEEEFEAGISLTGDEVKSIKNGQANLKGAYLEISNSEAYIRDMDISKYKQSSNQKYESKRKRKILLHKKEIEKLELNLQKSGLTAIPLELYAKKGKIKIKIGVMKGKKFYDKREDLKKKDQKREIEKMIKNF